MRHFQFYCSMQCFKNALDGNLKALIYLGGSITFVRLITSVPESIARMHYYYSKV